MSNEKCARARATKKWREKKAISASKLVANIAYVVPNVDNSIYELDNAIIRLYNHHHTFRTQAKCVGRADCGIKDVNKDNLCA